MTNSATSPPDKDQTPVTNTSRDRINNALVEIAIITVSIVLAFALERWWDAIVDSRLKDELVVSLIQEFEATGVELRSALQDHRDRMISASSLSELDEDSIGSIDPSKISEYWYGTVTPDETYPPTGALLSAINDNRLTLLGNSQLRSSLASWTYQLDDLRQTERVLANYTLQTFWPSVATDVVIPLNKETIGRETDSVVLLPATKNHLNLLSVGSSVAINQIVGLQEKLEEILRLLREELDG
ncbi:MAG: hypothetical protein AAGH76_10170 [Pseudomonadota bacterium]